jgi:hypothetical protein
MPAGREKTFHERKHVVEQKGSRFIRARSEDLKIFMKTPTGVWIGVSQFDQPGVATEWVGRQTQV